MSDIIRLEYSKESGAYPGDIDRMQEVLAAAGFMASRASLILLWEDYSEESCASWLFLPESDEDLRSILLNRLEGSRGG
jgi:hypothetical protein